MRPRSAKKAEIFKIVAKQRFDCQDFEGASLFYSGALEAYPEWSVLWSNRSICYLNLGEYIKALVDATRCVALNPKWNRGYFRMGQAYEKLGNLKDSLVAYKKALKRKPDHPQILLKVEGVESLLRGKNISNSQLANPTAPPLDSPQFTSVEELLVNCFWVRNYQKNHHMTTRATIASFFVFCKLIVKSKSLAFPADQLRWRLLCDIVTKEITKKIISFLEVLQFGFAMTLCFTWHDLIYGPAWIKNEEKMLFRLIRNETWAHLLTREDCFEDIGGVVLWREFDLNCRSADDAKTVSQ